MWYAVSVIFIVISAGFIMFIRKISEEKEKILEEKMRLENITVSLEERISDMEEEYRKYREGHKRESLKAGETRLIQDFNLFKKTMEKEIERRKRKSDLKFSVIMISIDFYDEYMKVYDNIEMETFKNEIIKFMESHLRKIDTVSYGTEEGSVYILLPMTAAEGAVILAARLQKKIESFKLEYKDKKIVATLTISVCETTKSENVEEIIGALYIMKKDGEEKGGNIVKIVKI